MSDMELQVKAKTSVRVAAHALTAGLPHNPAPAFEEKKRRNESFTLSDVKFKKKNKPRAA